MHRVIKDFLSKKQLDSITRTKTFKILGSMWFDMPAAYEYQNYILEEAASFIDISKAIGFEEWFHDPFFRGLPTKHYDKDEGLYAATKQLKFPLCSCILYMRVEQLEGAKLHIIDGETLVVPESNMLVLMAPGVYHQVTEYKSGIRTSVNLNPWSEKLYNASLNETKNNS
jgi:hypothetical protein